MIFSKKHLICWLGVLVLSLSPGYGSVAHAGTLIPRQPSVEVHMEALEILRASTQGRQRLVWQQEAPGQRMQSAPQPAVSVPRVSPAPAYPAPFAVQELPPSPVPSPFVPPVVPPAGGTIVPSPVQPAPVVVSAGVERGKAERQPRIAIVKPVPVPVKTTLPAAPVMSATKVEKQLPPPVDLKKMQAEADQNYKKMQERLKRMEEEEKMKAAAKAPAKPAAQDRTIALRTPSPPLPVSVLQGKKQSSSDHITAINKSVEKPVTPAAKSVVSPVVIKQTPLKTPPVLLSPPPAVEAVEKPVNKPAANKLKDKDITLTLPDMSPEKELSEIKPLPGDLPLPEPKETGGDRSLLLPPLESVPDLPLPGPVASAEIPQETERAVPPLPESVLPPPSPPPAPPVLPEATVKMKQEEEGWFSGISSAVTGFLTDEKPEGREQAARPASPPPALEKPVPEQPVAGNEKLPPLPPEVTEGFLAEKNIKPAKKDIKEKGKVPLKVRQEDSEKTTGLPALPTLPPLPALSQIKDLPDGDAADATDKSTILPALPGIKKNTQEENILTLLEDDIAAVAGESVSPSLPSLPEKEVLVSDSAAKPEPVEEDHKKLSGEMVAEPLPPLSDLPPIELASVPDKMIAEPLVPPVSKSEPEKPVKSSATPVASLPSDKGTPDLQISFAESETEVPLISQEPLKKLVNALRREPAKVVTVIAYAAGSDDQASIARRVSLTRALAVRAYLIDMGIDKLRINVKARGNEVVSGNPERADVFIKD